MEKVQKLILGLIGGLLLLFVNKNFISYNFLGGIVGFILDEVMDILSFVGLIAVEIISIILIIDAIKYISKNNKN